jgi:predicted transcriptional regulator
LKKLEKTRKIIRELEDERAKTEKQLKQLENQFLKVLLRMRKN